MNIRVRQIGTGRGRSRYGVFSGGLKLFMAVLLLSVSPGLMAQNEEQDAPAITEPGQPALAGQAPVEEVVDVVVSLPDSRQMALALTFPASRASALLDLAAAANVLRRAREADTDISQPELAQGFNDDRAWLQLLVDRYGWAQPRREVLDPAAWQVLKDLQQQDLKPMTLVLPGYASSNALIYQVFQRSGQKLAAANLPVFLLEIEADVFAIWDAFLQIAGAPELPDPAWKEVELAWFTDRHLPGPEELEPVAENGESSVEDISQAMSNLALTSVDSSPPDSRRLSQLRLSLLQDMANPDSALIPGQHKTGRQLLFLTSLIDGLHEDRYFEFVRGVLSITSQLLEDHALSEASALVSELDDIAAEPPSLQPEPPPQMELPFSLVDWLVAELPAISVHYAVNFAAVDPRLNSAMSATYDVLQNLADSARISDAPATIDIKLSRVKLANAVAQLALLIPDMGYYFDTPVRARIAAEINQCINTAAVRGDQPVPAMSRRQFDDCMRILLQLAERETRLVELSGDVNGPFAVDTLRRELSVTPWQRVNYGIGYLHENYLTVCQPPANALPNPLEWAVLADTMVWFAEYFPDFFKTPENESRLTEMRSIGEQLILDLTEQSGCLAAVGSSINEPVSRSLIDYELVLRELEEGIEKAEAEFRAQRLSPGADVSLEQNALQKTGFRPEGLLIGPCDTRSVCEMSGNLSTTRALIGLFPYEYLIAEQTGMGKIEICYRNMEWVDRRSELVRADDENVANYYGHLGFDLVGRYVDGRQVDDIFGFRFTSPGEHHYLFAQATGDVLDDSCPVEWVGSRVITPMRVNRAGIVPDRLTYLAAARTLPSRLLQNNWDRGAEWRDWFVTGIGVTPLEIPPAPDITPQLNLHLQSLFQEGQADIYQRLLLPNTRNSQGDLISLFDEMSQVSLAKSMITMQMMLFYPQSLLNSDEIRTAIAGDAGLLEGRTLRRFRADNVTLATVSKLARERLDEFRSVWSAQTEAVRRQGSLSSSLQHALTRINILYRQVFTSRPVPLQETEVEVETVE